MKKLTVGLAVLLSGYAATSLAGIPSGTSRCDVTVPSYCGGFTFGLTGLYWRPSTAHQDYALTYPSLDSATGDLLLTNGHYHSVGDKYNWGWSANVGYIFPCSGNDVTLRYTHWNNDNHDSVGTFAFADPSLSFFGDFTTLFTTSPITIVASVVPGTGVTGTFTTAVPAGTAIDLFANGFDVDTISARSEFTNHTWDLEFGQAINVGCNFRLHWFGGVRYSRLEHNLDVTTDFITDGTFFGASFTDIVTVAVSAEATSALISVTPAFDVTGALREVVNQKSDFNGVGPRFGIDASYNFCGGFGIVGSLSTSLLVGDIDSHYAERVTSTGGDVLFNPDETVIEGAVLPFTGVEFDAVVTDFSALTVDVDLADFTFVDTFSYHHPSETRVVPNVDAKLGVDWTYQFCNCSRTKLTIEAGYMVSHYWNAVDRLSATGLLQPEARSRQTLDMSFDGPYVGVQVAL